MAKKPMRGERAAKSKAKSKEFTPCSRCPNPASCKKAGMCLAKAMG